MSNWRYDAAGHKGALITNLQKATFGDDKLAGTAQRVITEMIYALPTDGAVVTMSGYSDDRAGGVTIEMRGVNLALDNQTGGHSTR